MIDDRLPTQYDQPKFMQATNGNEFWACLLEKAYAKLYGSYGALDGGFNSEAFEDFTGGLAETIDLKKAPDNLFTIMLKAQERNSMMGCNIDADPHIKEAVMPCGLVQGHAYTVTKVHLLDTDKGKTQLVIIHCYFICPLHRPPPTPRSLSDREVHKCIFLKKNIDSLSQSMG